MRPLRSMARRCTVVEVNVETKNEEEVQMSDVKKIAIDKHLEWKGKIEVIAQLRSVRPKSCPSRTDC